MKISSHSKAAINNLLFSPLRTLLAMVGIMIGTAAVVALVSSGKLAALKSMGEFKSLGTNLMTLDFTQSANQSGSNQNKIKLETLLALKSYVPAMNRIAPYVMSSMPAAYQDVNWTPSIIGTTPQLDKIIGINMKTGRFISGLDKSQYYCIIGSKIVDKLKTIAPLGQQIKLGNIIFTIIGTAKPWAENPFFYGDVDKSIIIPLELMQLISATELDINSALIQLKENANIDLVENEINDYVNKNMPGYTVSIESAKEIVKSMLAEKQTFTLLLGFIGGIALLVGGVGVMNIMLASVAERRYEIGLRLAVGAIPQDIQLMFLMEAIVLSMMGGLLGVLFGALCTYFVAAFSGWTFQFFFFPAILGFGFSVLTSVIFGVYPAYIASQLNPIDALRSS